MEESSVSELVPFTQKRAFRTKPEAAQRIYPKIWKPSTSAITHLRIALHPSRACPCSADSGTSEALGSKDAFLSDDSPPSPQPEQPSSSASPRAPRAQRAQPLTPAVSKEISHLALRAVKAARNIYLGSTFTSRVFYLFMHLCTVMYLRQFFFA